VIYNLPHMSTPIVHRVLETRAPLNRYFDRRMVDVCYFMRLIHSAGQKMTRGRSCFSPKETTTSSTTEGCMRDQITSTTRTSSALSKGMSLHHSVRVTSAEMIAR
jgi:hypothetical protein